MFIKLHTVNKSFELKTNKYLINLLLKALHEQPKTFFGCVGIGAFGTALETLFRIGKTLVNFGSICLPSKNY